MEANKNIINPNIYMNLSAYFIEYFVDLLEQELRIEILVPEYFTDDYFRIVSFMN